MAWEFSAECNDCDHKWDALMWNERIGHYNAEAQRFFCPKCCVHVSIAPDLDLYTFPKWLAANQASIDDAPVLQQIVGLITNAMSASTGLLIPLDSYASQMSCPTCNRGLVSGTIDDNPIVCPKCESNTARSTGVHSHVSLARVEDLDDQT